MSATRKIIKIFLASPGDLRDERSAAKTVIDEFNGEWADELGYHIELVGWEDTVSVYGRPQATINQELERCELFIGLMWKRWGTPPDTTGQYTSGFEEEFSISVDSKRKIGKPEISLFFKTVDPEQAQDPGDELKKVLAFRNRVIAQKNILFESFSDQRDFEHKFRRCISRYIQKLRRLEQAEVTIQRTEDSAAHNVSQADTNALPNLATNFLRLLASRMDLTVDDGGISPVEVARFRLLSMTISRAGNDDGVLGVHDANIIYAHRYSLQLSRAETLGLMESGLRHLESSNVPLWHWYASASKSEANLLAHNSVAGTSIPRRVGALSAMRLINEPIESAAGLTRADWVGMWLNSESPPAIKIAALKYLASSGHLADLPAIRMEFDRANYQTVSPATEAMINIKLRESQRSAVQLLLDIQAESIGSSLVRKLFENKKALPTDMLLQGTTHRNAAVRAIVAEILRERRALTTESAEQMLTDASADVRYEAMLTLAGAGRSYSDKDAKNILEGTEQKSSNYLASANLSGEKAWTRFLEHRLKTMSDSELEQIQSDNLLDRQPTLILAERHFASRGDSVRAGAKDHFDHEYRAIIETFGRAHNFKDAGSIFKSISDHQKKIITRQALDIICRKGDASDLPLVRELLDSGYVGYSSEDVAFLKTYGDWSDVSRIVASVSRQGETLGLLNFSRDGRVNFAANAIHTLGKDRLADIISIELPSDLLGSVIALIPKNEFSALDNEQLLTLLKHQNDEVRKLAAVKIIASVSKKRLLTLLGAYMAEGEFRYYNVIYWIDLGISLPRVSVIEVAKKILSEKLSSDW